MLKSIIAEAKDGDTIDIGSVGEVSSDDSYTIKQNNLTLKNGNVKNATFVVEGKGVVFENIDGIKKITVSDKVGDGDFTLKNGEEVGELFVNGGGANSVHIENAKVKKLSVNKKDVRIALDGNQTKVEKTYIFQDCKIESADEANSIASVVIDDAVKNLDLAGKAKIENVVSAPREIGNTVVIKVEVTVVVVAADSTVKNSLASNNIDYEVSEIKDAAISEEDKTELNSEEANSGTNTETNPGTNTEEKIVSTSLDKMDALPAEDILTGDLVPVVDTSEQNGIRINFTLPGTADIDVEYNVILDGWGYVYWGSGKGGTTGSFFYPYVDAGKEYRLRLKYSKGHNGWKDISVTPKGGLGEVVMTKAPKLSFDSCGSFKVVTVPEFSNENVFSDKRSLYITIALYGANWEWLAEVWDYYDEDYGWDEEDGCTLNIYLDLPSRFSIDKPIEILQYNVRYGYKDSNGKIWTYRWPTVEKFISLPAAKDAWFDVDKVDKSKYVGVTYVNTELVMGRTLLVSFTARRIKVIMIL